MKICIVSGSHDRSDPLVGAISLAQTAVESAHDHGAEMIVTPCQLCQANVEIYQS